MNSARTVYIFQPFLITVACQTFVAFFLSSLAVLSVEPGTEGCPLVFYGKQKFYYAQAQPTHFQYFCLYLLLFKFYFVI